MGWCEEAIWMFSGDFQGVGRNWDARTLADMMMQSDAFPAILKSAECWHMRGRKTINRSCRRWPS